MQYIQADEWDLSSLSLKTTHDLRKENIPVCLQTEIVCGNEKVILMNIFAPRNYIALSLLGNPHFKITWLLAKIGKNDL